MEFRNRTPFPALNYKMLDKEDEEHHVVVLKVGYQLTKTADGSYRADLLDKEPVPLCMADEYSGDINSRRYIRKAIWRLTSHYATSLLTARQKRRRA